MEKIFYHPERIKENSIPVYMNNYQHQALSHFLRTAESLVPELIDDLAKIIPLYTKTEEEYEDKETRTFLDEWSVLRDANKDHKSQLIPLREVLLQWVRRYNLIEEEKEDSIFLEIALWAIPSLRNYPESIEKKKTLYKKLGRAIPINFPKWSITEVVYFEDESDTIKLAENNESFTFDKYMPFIFTPSSENIHQYKIVKRDDELGDFENIKDDYKWDVMAAFNGEKENIFGYNGYGWDPRMYTWNEFEKKLDAAFEKYKKLYRARTENFMRENGYVEGKEKRNLEHFDWLVRYQIQGWGIGEIADYYSANGKIITEDTISKALRNTANLVGFQLNRNNVKEEE